MLTDKYLKAIPEGSRAAKENTALDRSLITEENRKRIEQLNGIAAGRGQTLAQMALSWNLRNSQVTSVLIGASSPGQIEENAAVIGKLEFTEDELKGIDRWAEEGGINLWANSSNAG
jgi:L-glyceraldehyde 3-phosphate reductase